MLESAHLITDAGLRHLTGIKKLHPVLPSARVTGTGFSHLAGIQDLNITGCTLVNDVGFQYLRGIRELAMGHCVLVTDAAFAHLAGIRFLNMWSCNQATITDKAFAHLPGIRSLDMSSCTQSTISAAALYNLAGIQYLDLDGCRFEVPRDTFARLRSLTSLRLNVNSLSTILAALQVFQGNLAAESSLWGGSVCLSITHTRYWRSPLERVGSIP